MKTRTLGSRIRIALFEIVLFAILMMGAFMMLVVIPRLIIWLLWW